MPMLRLNLEYKRDELTQAQKDQLIAQGQKILTDSDLTVDYIGFAVNSVYPGGFDSGGQRRTYGRLQRKLDAALDAKVDEVEITPDELDFLKKIFNSNPKFSPGLSKYVMVLEDHIADLK